MSLLFKKVLHYIISRYSLFLMAFIIIAMIEFLNRASFTDTLTWMLTHSIEFWLNYFIACCLLLLITALIGRTHWAIGFFSAAMLFISIISGIKFKTTGTPLFLWDVFLPQETTDVVRPFNSAMDLHLMIGAGFFVVMIVLLALVRHFRGMVPWRERVAFALISIFLLITVYADKPFPVKSWANLFTVGWDQANNELLNGYLLSTVMDIDLVRLNRPQGYNNHQMSTLINQIPRTKNIDTTIRPNVIVILSESLWDPTLMKNVTFSQDPIPFIHQLQQNYTSGTLLSPQFGGSTANVEFELLSGNSMRFLPNNSIAYIEYVNHGVDSLASIFARQGYVATAINPFFNWFFNSRNVYENLGFSRFISSEYFEPNYRGGYLKDSEVMNKVIEETEKSPGPDFIFANTMENHGPYTDKFLDNPITVEGPISNDSKNMLRNYATGINEADNALKQLIDYYSKSKEPAIVVFFGDHLPGLGDNYKVFKDTKYISGNDDPDFLTKMYSTPIIIWNNYLPPEQKETIHFSPSYVGPYVLQLAKKEGTYYTDYLYALSKRIPIIPPESYYPAMHIHKSDLLDYQRMQYDILAGKRYGYRDQGIKDKIINPAFALGYGNPAIEKAEILDKRTLRVTGNRFENDSTLFLNDKPLRTTWIDQHTLSAVLPAHFQSKKGHADVQVKLIDYKHVVISESKRFQLPLGAP